MKWRFNEVRNPQIQNPGSTERAGGQKLKAGRNRYCMFHGAWSMEHETLHYCYSPETKIQINLDILDFVSSCFEMLFLLPYKLPWYNDGRRFCMKKWHFLVVFFLSCIAVLQIFISVSFILDLSEFSSSLISWSHVWLVISDFSDSH